MERIEIIDAVGRKYATSNIENGEFSYPKAFKEKNLEFEPIKKKSGKGSWQFLDIRFELDGVSLLIETKNDADKWPTAEEQIAAYVEYEKRLTGNKIIAMVANTTNDHITVCKSEVEDDRKLASEDAIRTMPECPPFSRSSSRYSANFPISSFGKLTVVSIGLVNCASWISSLDMIEGI